MAAISRLGPTSSGKKAGVKAMGGKLFFVESFNKPRIFQFLDEASIHELSRIHSRCLWVGQGHLLQDSLVSLQRRVGGIRHYLSKPRPSMLKHLSVFHSGVFAHNVA